MYKNPYGHFDFPLVQADFMRFKKKRIMFCNRDIRSEILIRLYYYYYINIQVFYFLYFFKVICFGVIVTINRYTTLKACFLNSLKGIKITDNEWYSLKPSIFCWEIHILFTFLWFARIFNDQEALSMQMYFCSFLSCLSSTIFWER